MQFSAKIESAATSPDKASCRIIGIFEAADKQAAPQVAHAAHAAAESLIPQSAQSMIAAVLSRGECNGEFRGELGMTEMLHLSGELQDEGRIESRIVLLGLGKQTDFTPSVMKHAATAAAAYLDHRAIVAADFCLPALPPQSNANRKPAAADPKKLARAIAEGVFDALYRYHRTKNKSAKKIRPIALKNIGVLSTQADHADIARGLVEGAAISRGVELARDLGNMPGNLCTPTFLADEAKRIGRECDLKITVLDEKKMAKLNMNSLLSVSRGSREPAKLIIMEYHGASPKNNARDSAPIMLIGKGLTFDAGGISLKSANAMDEMKFDMCGAASVFGAVQAAAELKLDINLIGIVPSSENLPDGAANKPGDIVTAMSGTTIEILNTDAEGRLILCDALTYAERYQPAAVVDIATLTGACVVALGEYASGLFSDCDALAEKLLRAGDASGDRAWRMPVWKDYDAQLQSNFADLANIGGGKAGAVTAACFLRHFTDKFDWAHLDIAGTAWKSGGEKGATGRPVPLLVEFLLNY